MSKGHRKVTTNSFHDWATVITYVQHSFCDLAARVLPTQLGFWPRVDLVDTLRWHSTETKSLPSGTSWGCGNTDRLGNHAEPDVASFQMMGNYLVTSACLQFLTSCPLGKWISLQKSNSKFKCPRQIPWRKITSEEDVISVGKEKLCYCEICFSFRLFKILLHNWEGAPRISTGPPKD
jgi:hypothetical protein